MKTHFKKRFKKLKILLILIFFVLFIFRLIHGYNKKYYDEQSQSQSFDNITSTQKNYATKKYSVKSKNSNRSAINVDQKYEKIAAIKTKSSKFERDEKIARKTIEKMDALIQFEQKSGNEGYRKLNLVIGVPSGNFDSIYKQLIKVGRIDAKQITKKDKTNEYKELNSNKNSLEKVRNSLIELKSKGGKIEEYMALEDRILQIEKQLQELGVSLGDFDDENEFCTVQFSLVEEIEGKEIKIGIIQRIKVALEWTVKIYLRLMTTLFFLSLFSYFIILAIDKFKIVKKITNRKEEEEEEE